MFVQRSNIAGMQRWSVFSDNTDCGYTEAEEEDTHLADVCQFWLEGVLLVNILIPQMYRVSHKKCRSRTPLTFVHLQIRIFQWSSIPFQDDAKIFH